MLLDPGCTSFYYKLQFVAAKQRCGLRLGSSNHRRAKGCGNEIQTNLRKMNVTYSVVSLDIRNSRIMTRLRQGRPENALLHRASDEVSICNIKGRVTVE